MVIVCDVPGLTVEAVQVICMSWTAAVLLILLTERARPAAKKLWEHQIGLGGQLLSVRETPFVNIDKICFIKQC